MPLPALTEHRLLPEGVHDCTLDQVEEEFGSFQRTDCRPRLFSQLRAYVKELRTSGLPVQLVIDGSFVMPPVEEPGDIDMVLVMPKEWDVSSEVRPFEYNLLSKRRVQKTYGFDIFVVRAESDEEREMVEFFQRIKEERCRLLDLPTSTKKGILRISL